MAWEYELGAMFKDRDNPTNTPIGACIGKVTSLNPPQITIQNGNYIIDGKQLYICNQLLERDTTYKNHSSSGSISIDCHPCNGNFTSNSTGSIHLDAVWQVGDLVLVIPSQSEQQFFVVDVLRKVDGCNEHAV